MTTTELEKIHKAQPFRPFTLKMAGGRSIPVNHPEFMAYRPGSRTTVVYVGENDFEVIDLLLIEAIHVRSHGQRQKKAG